MPLLSVVGSGYQHFENADLDLSAHKCYYITFFPKDYRELPLPSPLRPEALCQAKIYPRLIVGFVVAISLILTLSFLLAVSYSFSLSHSLSLSLCLSQEEESLWIIRECADCLTGSLPGSRQPASSTTNARMYRRNHHNTLSIDYTF